MYGDNLGYFEMSLFKLKQLWTLFGQLLENFGNFLFRTLVTLPGSFHTEWAKSPAYIGEQQNPHYSISVDIPMQILL